MRYFAGLLLCLALFCSVSAVSAQTDQWRERSTANFTILYAVGNEDQAERYAGFADSIFDQITGAFGHRVATPITLRLYPDLEQYYAINPRARGMSGVVAHADFRRNEVVVILSQTAKQSEEDVVNNIRHELTHIVAADLSDNRLNAGFQEGLAQYLETPTGEFDAKLRLLRTAVEQQRLLPWSSFDDRETIYGDPNTSYPQTLSVVAFLAQRYTFTKLRDFVQISATSSGYRSALERAFGVSPNTLEQDWQNWLPDYVAGAPQKPSTATASYDLGHAQELIRGGAYTQALQELQAAVAGLRAGGQAEVAGQAEALIAQSQAGIAADGLAQQAHETIAAADYARAAVLVAQAQAAYAALGDTRQAAVLAAYAERAQRGEQARQRLEEALALTKLLRFPQARALADAAAADYTALGDRERATQALELRAFLDQRQSLIGGVLILLGLGGAAISVARRVLAPEVEPW